MPTYYEELIRDGVPDKIDAEGFTFEDIFDEHIANNQKTWKQDRRLTVGASECFGCILNTWFEKRGHEFGYEPDDDHEESWGAMERGNIIENSYIVPAVEAGLERRGLKLIMAGDGQDTIIDGIHSATLDGLIIPVDPALGGKIPADFLAYYGLEDLDTDSLVLEMKSFDPRVPLIHEKPQHRGQTQMQMGLVRDTTEYRPTHAVLLYINASWLDDIRSFIIPWEPETYQMGRARNEKVFSTDDPALLPWEGKMDGTYKYSRWKKSSAETRANRVPVTRKALTKKEVSAQDDDLVNALDELVAKQGSAKIEKEAAEKKLETINEEIRQELISANESRAVGQGWKVYYSHQGGTKRLSAKLIEDAGLDPEDFKEQGAGFEKLTITREKK